MASNDKHRDLLKRLRAPHSAYGRVGQLRALMNEAADAIEGTVAPSHGGQGKPRGAYEPLTEAQIESLRDNIKGAVSNLWAQVEGRLIRERVDTLCDMAINALLYGEEIDRLRSSPSSTREHSALADKLHGMGDSAYCHAMTLSKRDLCLGEEHKIKSGSFTIANLKALEEVCAEFGRAAGLWEASKVVRSMAPSATPRGMALVCATCRFPVPDDGTRYCDAGEACPHRSESRNER